jgi:hypothetical protein
MGMFGGISFSAVSFVLRHCSLALAKSRSFEFSVLGAG